MNKEKKIMKQGKKKQKRKAVTKIKMLKIKKLTYTTNFF